MLVNLSKVRAAKGLEADKPMGAKNAPLEIWCVIGADGQPEHFATWSEACHEHINEAAELWGGASQSVVRRYVLAEKS